MQDMTPLEKLGEAIREFFKTTGSFPDGAFVTSWAVVAGHTRIQADDPTCLPMVDGAQYALGPETTAIQAAGLAKFLDVVIERATWQMLNEPDGDDD